MAAHEIVVGASLSLSGRFAAQGRQAHDGLTLWAADTNRAGGLLVRPGEPRRPVRLLVHDDASRRAVAAEYTHHLIERERVDLLFGPYASVLTLAAAEVAADHDRTLWNHSGSSDAVVERGWRHVINLLSPASIYFAPILDLAAQAPGEPVRRVALLRGASGTFPAAVIGGARADARRLGLEIVYDGTYEDMAGEASGVRPLLSTAPDLILGAGTTEADIAFARTLRTIPAAEVWAPADQAPAGRAPLVGLVAAAVQPFRDALGADAAGFCGPSQWEAGASTGQDAPEIGPTSAEFAAAFEARFGMAPDYPAAQAYAAGLIAAGCIELAGSLEDRAIRAVAAQLDTSTFYGRFRTDPTTGQQIGHKVVVTQWQGGRKQVVWPPAMATAALAWTESH